jgi:hypothetical protein
MKEMWVPTVKALMASPRRRSIMGGAVEMGKPRPPIEARS